MIKVWFGLVIGLRLEKRMIRGLGGEVFIKSDEEGGEFGEAVGCSNSGDLWRH